MISQYALSLVLLDLTPGPSSCGARKTVRERYRVLSFRFSTAATRSPRSSRFAALGSLPSPPLLTLLVRGPRLRLLCLRLCAVRRRTSPRLWQSAPPPFSDARACEKHTSTGGFALTKPLFLCYIIGYRDIANAPNTANVINHNIFAPKATNLHESC